MKSEPSLQSYVGCVLQQNLLLPFTTIFVTTGRRKDLSLHFCSSFSLLIIQKIFYLKPSTSSARNTSLARRGDQEHIPTNYRKALSMNPHNAQVPSHNSSASMSCVRFLFCRAVPGRGGRDGLAKSLDVFLARNFILGKTERGVCRECCDLGLG